MPPQSHALPATVLFLERTPALQERIQRSLQEVMNPSTTLGRAASATPAEDETDGAKIEGSRSSQKSCRRTDHLPGALFGSALRKTDTSERLLLRIGSMRKLISAVDPLAVTDWAWCMTSCVTVKTIVEHNATQMVVWTWSRFVL
jgi:hypothetical protein